jgi:hypothetical protein
MENFSDYEQKVIRKLLCCDNNRKQWDTYVGIPVLCFISDFLRQEEIYTSYEDNTIKFKYSEIKYPDREKDIALLDNQRKVLFMLHLIYKLSQDNYIACIELTPDAIGGELQTFTRRQSSQPETQNFSFDFNSLQKSFRDCLYQAILVTDELRELVENDFKTINQIRHEKEITKMQEQIDKANESLCWTKRAFVVALLTAIIAIFSPLVSKWTTPKDITISELKYTIEEKKLPTVFDVNILNDTIFLMKEVNQVKELKK